MKKIVMTAFIAAFMLAACGGEDSDQAGMTDDLTPIEVELNVPTQAEAREDVLFESIVTQGDDLVEDAQEVVYEVWAEGQKESSEMIEATDQEENRYLLTHVFTEEGTYHVQTHVTARGLHRMPTSEIVIGSGEHAEDQADEEASEEKEEHAHDHSASHDHHHNHADVDVEADIKDDILSFTIMLQGEPLDNGRITIEMWQGEEKPHLWLDTSEVSNGVYELNEIDEYTGSYDAIVHIERDEDDLHEHFTVELEFK
ncbi:FixH family protein [Bacillus sp. FJAT-45037]|uniref:FixH family protein n=1 Tax=Bacillus sp. FJAT-45037 TaxID=2011007 RepID=UPI0012FE1113|nr:FixH family protein [Bacillus sp. FJAT-45037]